MTPATKAILESDFNSVLANYADYALQERIDAEAKVDNRRLFYYFLADQWRLLQVIVKLRFPFGAYVRDEIAEAIADRECGRNDVAASAADYDARRQAAKGRVYPEALERRAEPQFLGVHQEVKERFRTSRLRHIHGAAVKAGDIYTALEEAAASGDAQRLAGEETKAVMWIANNLSCAALLQMVNVAQNAGLAHPGDGDSARRKQFEKMIRLSRKVEGLRNELVKLNLRIAKRHAELAPAAMDANSRLSFAYQGLLEAVDRYSPTLPAPFEGFAPTWVSQAIRRGMQQSAGLIATPINVQKNAANVRDYIASEVERGRSRLAITKEEMLRNVRDAAGEKGISADGLEKALLVPVVRSLDAPIVEGAEEETDCYARTAADDPGAAARQMLSERDDALRGVIYQNTTSAERVLLSFASDWGNLAVLTKEFVEELIDHSREFTSDRIESAHPCPERKRAVAAM